MSQEDWVRAADGGDVATVRELIATVTDSDRSSALYRAIQRDDLAIVQEIIKGGEALEDHHLSYALDDNAENVARWIVSERPGAAARDCMFASACGKTTPEILELLLANGAKLDDRSRGWSGLAYATRHGRTDVVEWLLKKKAAVRGWLLGAAGVGDLVTAKRALKAGDDLSVVDENGLSPLMLAAAGNHMEVARWILDELGVAKPKTTAKPAKQSKTSKPSKASKQAKTASSSPLDVTDSDGRTAIAHAAIHGHIDMVRFLADAGAELDAAMSYVANDYKNPPSALAIAELLLERGADIDARQESGRDTALIAAAEHGYLALVDLLLDRGANLHLGNIIDTTPISGAANRGHVDVVKRLLAAGARLTMSSRSYSDSPLVNAIANGNLELVRLFIDRGALDAEARKPPLIAAAQKGNREIVELLLDRGADVNWVDDSYDQDTALRKAAARGHKGVVELLLDRGAVEPGPREGYDVDEYTAIRRAGASGHLEIVELLAARDLGDPATSGIVMGVAEASNDPQRLERALAIAPDANAPGNYGWLPLHRACDRGHLDNVRVLLDHGADPNLADKDGNVPHRVATNNKHREVAALLEARGARLELVDLVDLAGRGTDAEVLAMLERPLNVNIVRADDNRRALHEAAEHGRLAIARALLDKGAELDAVDRDGWTALMEAADMGHTALVELLLDRKAAPFVADRQGFTAFALAEEAGRADVVALMRARSADVDPAVALQRAIDEQDVATIARLAPLHGFTNPLPSYRIPLDHAAFESKPASVTALIAAGADVDHASDSGYTALYHAAEQGDLATVRALLDGGAKPRANGTAQRAVWKGSTEIVAALLDAGFDKDEMHGESTLLGMAYYYEHGDIVRLLLDRGASIEGAAGASMFERAVDRDDHALVADLLARGVRVDAAKYGMADKVEAWIGEGRTITLLDPNAALDHAATDDKLVLLELALAQGADKNGVKDEDPPIIGAAKYGHWRIVERLLAAGADATVRDYRSLAQFVALAGQFALLEKLAAAGAKLDGCIALLIEQDKLPKKPAERDRITALCLAHGDSLDALGDNEQTPLARALENKDAALAKLLVASGASVNAPSKYGRTPLMVAASIEDDAASLSLVKWLVEKGATVGTATETGATAIHLAVRVGNEKVVDFLLARGAAIAGCLSESGSSGRMSLVEKFLDKCELEEKDSTDATAVMNAAAGKSKKLFEFFLERGASVAQCGIQAAWGGNKAHLAIALKRGALVDATDSEGRTALMCAVDNVPCVELLLKQGASLDVQDARGRSALIYAAMYSEKKTIELLLAAGANRGLRDSEGKSAADYARYDRELHDVLEV